MEALQCRYAEERHELATEIAQTERDRADLQEQVNELKARPVISLDDHRAVQDQLDDAHSRLADLFAAAGSTVLLAQPTARSLTRPCMWITEGLGGRGPVEGVELHVTGVRREGAEAARGSDPLARTRPWAACPQKISWGALRGAPQTPSRLAGPGAGPCGPRDVLGGPPPPHASPAEALSGPRALEGATLKNRPLSVRRPHVQI